VRRGVQALRGEEEDGGGERKEKGGGGRRRGLLSISSHAIRVTPFVTQ
jgi:hypothetical protein